MNKTKLAIAVIATQIFSTHSVAVHAQVLEEVLVTARKKTESLMDVPVAVSVVSGAEMDNQGITNLEQLSSQVPGLQLGRSALTSSIYIRGIGSGGNLGFEQSVGMYVDGIYQTRSRQFTQSLVDLDRIEFLRGPQSLLFGKNTVAGAIKVESSNPVPGDDFNGYLMADIEPEYGTARGTAVLSGSLSDSFAARLSVRYQESDGYVDNVYIDRDVAQRDDTIARLSLVWQPSDTLRFTGKLSRTKMESIGIEQTNPVADSTLLDQTLAGNTQLIPTQVVGAIAAFATPGFAAATGSKAYDSWTGNLDWAPYDEEETESNQASLRVDWELERFTLTSLTGYSDFSFEQQHDVDFHPGNVAGGVSTEDVELFSQEFRIASDFDGFFNFTAGVYYEEQELQIDANPTLDGSLGGLLGQLPANALSPSLPPLPLSTLGVNSAWNGLVLSSLDPANAVLIGAEQINIYSGVTNKNDNDTLAFFGELTFDLSDSLFLDVGGRWSEDSKKTNKQVQLGVGAPGEQTVVIGSDGVPTGALDAQNTGVVAVSWALASAYPHNQDLKRDESHFDPSVRLRWDMSDDTMTYISYVEGYKSGGFNPSGDSANPDGTPGPGTEFDDEQAQAWELGVKTTFWDGRARLSTTLFRTEIEDLQVTSFRGLTFVVDNAAAMTSQGLEMEGQFALSEEWEVGGSFAYLDSEFDDYTNGPCTIGQVAAVGADCSQDLSGERGPNAPEWSGVVYANYEQAMGDNFLFRFNINGAYKDEYFLDGDLDPNTLQDSYFKLNARIALAGGDDSWEIALYGRNLTDETTYTFATDAPLSAGIYGGWVEEPMIVGLQGRYNF
jgi:iron complex outermembrane receptor protein